MNRENGYNTRKREKILEFLQNNHDKAVTIGDIRFFLEQQQTQVSLSTIYRYLEKLEEKGIVLKTVNGKREQAAFQYIGGRKDCHEHLHMKCQVCGIILHLDCGFMEELSEHVMEEHGFVLNCQESYLTGVCQTCSGQRIDRRRHCVCRGEIENIKGRRYL